jgi:hypothetical protein
VRKNCSDEKTFEIARKNTSQNIFLWIFLPMLAKHNRFENNMGYVLAF